MTIEFTSVRKEYERGRLLEANVPADPLILFNVWMAEAVAANIREPNAMTVATATADGHPSARVLLLKGVDAAGFSFFTNYSSHKGEELAVNPWVALCFWWGVLERQIRIEGKAEKLPAEESDAYYNSRPLGARVGAHASTQSQVIASRDVLEARYFNLMHHFSEENPPPRPAHWGGYLVRPALIEFWQGGPHRLHDRLRYSRQADGTWQIERLSP